MKRNIFTSILLLWVMQSFALPNLIGRWQSAPIWERFEKLCYEINFKDSVHMEARLVVDNTDFADGERITQSMGGTYQLQDSLCLLTADFSTFSVSSSSYPVPIWPETNEVDTFLILPSNNSEDIIALIDHLNHDVFILYRQKE